MKNIIIIPNKFTSYSLISLTLIAIPAFVGVSVLAAEVGEDGIHWGEMMMGLFGGLALFLFGMEQISDALKSALGDQMKVLLEKLTRNRFTGALTGAFVTAVIQSSSVTTVLVVGFVSAGMMTLPQSIGVIMGANVGTTITAQIVAFKVDEAALWMIAIGFLVSFISKQEKIKLYGIILMGLGLIFFGMSLMGDAMYPLRIYEPFIDIMAQMKNVLFAILIGAAFTALVQSSSATTAVVITMAGQGLIGLETGIAITLGAKIGTCVTAQLAALGKSREALRAAVVHLVFNVSGVVIWIPFIALLSSMVIAISPDHPELTGTARLAAEVPRQIANAYTVFNVLNMVIFIWFTSYFAKLVTWLVPIKEEEIEKVIIKSKYLDKSLLDTPAVALQNVRFEIARMGKIVQEMLIEFREAMLNRNRDKLHEVHKMDDRVDILDGEILRYLASLRTETLSEQDSADISVAMKVADSIESIGDVIDTDLFEVGERVLEKDIQPSDAMQHIYSELVNKLSLALTLTIKTIKETDQISAEKVLLMKPEINRLLKEALEYQTKELKFLESDQVDIIRLEMSALESMKRIYTLLKRITKEFVPIEIRE